MSVGFGFSVGDFIAALELTSKVIDALRSSSEAGSEYRELLAQLFSLETALLQVKRLDCDDVQYQEIVALRQAAAQCKRTINAFWVKIAKYQPSLEGRASGSTLRDGWMKIRWTLCRKDNIMKFKSDLAGHTRAIQILVATVQMSRTKINENRQETRQQSLMARVQEGYFKCMQRIDLKIDQGKQLQEMTISVMQTVIKTFQVVLNIQEIITRISPQVDGQRPVFMIDALGKPSPFSLEFVRSPEALVATLKTNFRKYGDAEDKIGRGDFAIHDAITKRDVDLSGDWDLCFAPGQRVIMSLILDQNLKSNTICPKCDAATPVVTQEEELGGKDLDIECFNCGLSYRLVSSVPELQSISLPGEDCVDKSVAGSPIFGPKRSLKRKQPHDEIAAFQHVRIRDDKSSQTDRRFKDIWKGNTRILWACKSCHEAGKECLSKGRVWPQKCQRCIQHQPEELKCSRPREKKKYDKIPTPWSPGMPLMMRTL